MDIHYFKVLRRNTVRTLVLCKIFIFGFENLRIGNLPLITEKISVLERILMMIIKTGNFSKGILRTVILATLPREFDTADKSLNKIISHYDII